MNMKLILAVVSMSAALSACSPTNERIPINRTLGDAKSQKSTGGTTDASLATFATNECLDLKGLSTALAKTNSTFALYTSDLQLGTSADQNTRNNFVYDTDARLAWEVLHTVPLSLSVTSSELLAAPAALSSLLSISTQKDCESVTFQDTAGALTTYNISDHHAGVLVMQNPLTQVVRRYNFNNEGELQVTVFTNFTNEDCLKQPVNRVLRQVQTIAWGSKLVEDFELPVSFIRSIPSDVLLPATFTIPAAAVADNGRKSEVQGSIVVSQADYQVLQDRLKSSDSTVNNCK